MFLPDSGWSIPKMIKKIVRKLKNFILAKAGRERPKKYYKKFFNSG